MDAKSVERFILLGFDERVVGKTDKIEKDLLTASIRWFVFAMLVFGFGFLTFESHISLGGWRMFLFTFEYGVSPLPFVIMACFIPVMAKHEIRKINRRVEEISKGINAGREDMSKYDRYALIGPAAGVTAMGIARVVFRTFPSATPVLTFLIFWVVTFYILMRAVDRLYKIHLIRAYCPYLITPADKRYNDDLYGEKSDKT